MTGRFDEKKAPRANQTATAITQDTKPSGWFPSAVRTVVIVGIGPAVQIEVLTNYGEFSPGDRMSPTGGSFQCCTTADQSTVLCDDRTPFGRGGG